MCVRGVKSVCSRKKTNILSVIKVNCFQKVIFTSWYSKNYNVSLWLIISDLHIPIIVQKLYLTCLRYAYARKKGKVQQRHLRCYEHTLYIYCIIIKIKCKIVPKTSFMNGTKLSVKREGLYSQPSYSLSFLFVFFFFLNIFFVH